MTADDEMALLCRYLGDVRSVLPGPAAGVLQLMYPPLGAAVAAQSEFFDDPFARIYRSVPQIWAVVLDADAPTRGRQVRDVHAGIKGVDGNGQRFHALDAETFWWAHATFTWEVFRSIALFHPGGLGRVDTDRLYAETVAWYRRYGMSMRPVPGTYAAFEAKFAAVCADTLQRTPAADRVLEMALAGQWRGPFSADYFRHPLLRRAGRLAVIGGLPAEVRDRFGLPWSRRDAAEYAAGAFGMGVACGLVPPPLRRPLLEWRLRVLGSRTRHERYVPSVAA